MSFRISYNRYEQIKRIVTQTFIRYGVNCIPVSAFELASKMGATVIPYSAYSKEKRETISYFSNDGFSALYDGQWYIFYNDELPYKRINNTLMHEIGHIVLDHTQESDLAEAEANFFAKFALAPPVLIHKLEPQDEIQLANLFDISLEAATYAMEYYRKWLEYGGSEYKDYEIRLLNLFGLAV